MDHVLDNPAWNALISGNGELANGLVDVKYFNKEVSPFVGLKESSVENFQVLRELIRHDAPVAFISPVEMEIPLQWKVIQPLKCLQMVYDGPVSSPDTEIELVPIEEKHVATMLALTKLTNPGPFAEQTIRFGHYKGIFIDGKLVAMAGQRLNPVPYAEISAVCTHPEYLGRGYARRLLLYHVQRIKTAGGIPFLHVRQNNERAVKVYESLGFVNRKVMHFYVLQKAH